MVARAAQVRQTVEDNRRGRERGVSRVARLPLHLGDHGCDIQLLLALHTRARTQAHTRTRHYARARTHTRQRQGVNEQPKDQ